MKKERPTVIQVKVYCQDCEHWNFHYMTNQEIHSNCQVEQWCTDCKKITKWKQEIEK